MKVALPVNDQTMEACVCQSFGRAQYFLIYDTEFKKTSFLDNSGAVSQGGAGIKAAQTIVDSKASALITPRCGENAAKVMKAAKVKIYQTINDSIQDNLTAFSAGKLSLLTDIHPGFHNHGQR